MTDRWFDSWDAVLRVVLGGAATYVALVVLVRLSGKRTLSQLNAFDFVVRVAQGSVLATVLTRADVFFVEDATAAPVLLLADGRIRHNALLRNRLTESEQAVRMQGTGDLSKVKAVVLETNGKLSVITDDQYGSGSALEDVHGNGDL